MEKMSNTNDYFIFYWSFEIQGERTLLVDLIELRGRGRFMQVICGA